MALCHVDFFSNVLGQCMQMDVILPERTQGQIGMEGHVDAGKYPTLYLLHGMSDDHTIWQRRTIIERYASEHSLAVVMPGVSLSWYTDMYSSDTCRYFTYVSQELPRICRDFFPNMSPRREDTWKDICTIVGFISSIAGLFTFWVVLCPMGLLTSCLGYRGNHTRGLAVAGIIISLLAIAIKIGFILYHLDVLPSWLTDGAL